MTDGGRGIVLTTLTYMRNISRMAIKIKKVQQAVCQRCGHSWVPRVLKFEQLRQCPKCKTARWDEPKAETKTAQA